MIQQVTITTESPEKVKPLLETAIQNELKLLEHGIARTRERLAAFESRFAMTTGEFERRFDGKDLKETLDFLDWWGEIKMLRLLEDKHRALAGARID
jgi:hypothetical protein